MADRHVRGVAVIPCSPATLSVLQSERLSDESRILKRFDEEIAALERELKVDLPKEIQRARELGDLRENAEYKRPRSGRTSSTRASPC